MINIRDVSKFYEGTYALDSVSLDIIDRKAYVIWGPSGSGKSSLLRLIAGLDLPDKGEIWMDKVCVSNARCATAPHSRQIGYMFQRSALWPHMTVTQNITFVISDIPKPKAVTRAKRLLDQMAIGNLGGRYPHQLSGGEARRVALARALAPQPRYLMLDEPLTSLEPALSESLLRVIQEHVHKTDSTLIYVTHNPQEVEQIGGQMIRLQHGKCIN
jgi:iron(III) transport system ATP-binding protein